jgi:hypothetical protein
MPEFVIEREIPGAGGLADQQHASSQKSGAVLNGMGPQIEWIHSYVADHKIYCYQAPDEAMVREHARQDGFPANNVARVHAIIHPAPAE